MTERHDIAEQFYRILWPLLRYANGKLGIIADPPSWPPGMDEAEPLVRELWKHDDVIAAFVTENPDNLSEGDLRVLASWRHRVEDDFWVLRYLKKYAVFLSSQSPQRAYGVVSLYTPFEAVLGFDLPRLVHTVLLPVGEVITYHGLFLGYPVSFGPGIRRGREREYRNAREREGVISSLPPAPRSEASAAESVRRTNERILRSFGNALANSGLTLRTANAYASLIEEFTRGHLLRLNPPRPIPEMTEEDVAHYVRRGRAARVPPRSLKGAFNRFLGFLHESGRIDWQHGDRLVRSLFHAE
jgi:hypothetical protein